MPGQQGLFQQDPRYIGQLGLPALPCHARDQPLGEQVNDRTALGAASAGAAMIGMDRSDQFAVDPEREGDDCSDSGLFQLFPKPVRGGQMVDALQEYIFCIADQRDRIRIAIGDDPGQIAGQARDIARQFPIV